MRGVIVLSSVLLATLGGAALSCGGSSSETPWPAEPSPHIIAPPPDVSPDGDAGANKR